MKITHRIRQIAFALISIGSLLVGTRISHADPPYSQDYWISPTNVSGGGNGTLSNPYDGSTLMNFDNVMTNRSKFPLNSTMHLLAGVFQTAGTYTNGWLVGTGQKVVGSGLNQTTIRLNFSNTYIGNIDSYNSANSKAVTNAQIVDLTVDGNGASGGIVLFGDHVVVQRVRCVNMASSGPETFPILIDASPNTTYGSSIPSEGNLIEGCEVILTNSSWISAIAMTGVEGNPIQGAIRNNRIIIPPKSIACGSTGNNCSMGINVCSIRDSLIEGNYVSGADFGIYSDSGSSINLIISHNSINGAFSGVQFYPWPTTNLTCAFNNIGIKGSASNGDAISFFIQSTPVNATRNIVIIGNTLTYVPGSGSGYAFCERMQNTLGALFVNNTLDYRLVPCLYSPYPVNFSIYNNTDLTGGALAFNQDPAHALERTAVHTNYAVQAYDRYIAVSSGTAVTITLPDATTIGSGKEYVIVREDTSGAVTTISSAQNINGVTGPITLSPVSSTSRPISAATLVSDGIGWWVR